jgi:GNAT superfamily N-acetyltransferase
VEIKTVKSRKDLKEFILFAWKIYKGDPNWVPPLIAEVNFILDPQKNPFWEHAEQILLLAKENGKVVGRIAGIIDQRHIEFHNEKVGFFGFFEAIDDYQVAEALLNRVREWLKEKGMEAMRGPMNPSQNDECGLLVQGFDSSPVMMMTYNPKYYLDFMNKYGLQKARDLYAYHAPITPVEAKHPAAAAKYAHEKHPEAVVRKVDIKRLEQEKVKVQEIYNAAWEKNWGFVPLTDKEFDALVKRLKDILIPELALFVEIQGKPVGFLLSLPDVNLALKKINGRLFPFGWLKALYYSRKIKWTRLIIMGVLKEYRLCGFEALLYHEATRNAYKLGFRDVEISWVLENNLLTRMAAEKYGGAIYKTYRIYQIDI